MAYLDELASALESGADDLPRLETQLNQDEEAVLVALLARELIRCQQQGLGMAQLKARFRLAAISRTIVQQAEDFIEKLVIAVQQVLSMDIPDASLPAEVESALMTLGVRRELVKAVMPVLGRGKSGVRRFVGITNIGNPLRCQQQRRRGKSGVRRFVGITNIGIRGQEICGWVQGIRG